MNNLDSVINATRTARAKGQRVVGYVGADVPPELIVAAGACPIRLTGIANQPTPTADRYIEPSFSPETRSIADRWLSGALDDFTSVVFSRSDDSAQRMYYYICELQRMGRCKGPTPLLFDIPKVRRDTSTHHAIESTLRLARELGTDSDKLEQAASELNVTRRALAQVNARRGKDQPPLGSAVFELEQSLWTQAAMPLADVPVTNAKQRLMLVGSAPPDARLHRAVERSDATIVRELHEPLAWTSIDLSTPVSLESLATHYHEASLRQREQLRSPSLLLDAVAQARVTAAIVWLIEEDTGIAWELPIIQRALAQASIPTLVLTRQQWAAGPNILEACASFAAHPERT